MNYFQNGNNHRSMASRRLASVVALSLLVVLVAPETAATNTERGYASAYAPGVMDEVIRYRLDNDIWPHGEPPRDWYAAHGAIAAMDCSKVGQMATLIDPDGREYRVLVADCAGDDGPPDRFERNRIIVELDWNLWTRLTAEHGRPLEVGLR